MRCSFRILHEIITFGWIVFLTSIDSAGIPLHKPGPKIQPCGETERKVDRVARELRMSVESLVLSYPELRIPRSTIADGTNL